MKTSLEIFAQNLRDTLEAQRKSQSDLARHTGATTVSVSRWVNAQSMPRANMLDKICRYLNCTAEDLMTDHSKVAVMLPQDILAEEIENNPRLMRLRVTRHQKSKKAGLSPCLLLWRLYEEKEALCSFAGA